MDANQKSMSKKTLIKIQDGDSRLYVNPRELRSLEVVEDSDVKFSLSVISTEHSAEFTVSKYLASEKLQAALGERYNLVVLKPNSAKVINNRHSATVLVVKESPGDDEQSVTTYIFPRGLVSVERQGGNIVVSGYDLEIELEMEPQQRDAVREAMELLNLHQLAA